MTVRSKVRRAPDNEPGSWLYEVIASTEEAVSARVNEIQSGRNVKDALFLPIVEFGERDYRSRGHVLSRLYVVRGEPQQGDGHHV